MRKKTRGGKLLGKGAHGIVYNVGSDSLDPNFYTILKSKPIQSFRIYSSDGFFKTYMKPEHIILFQEYIRTTKNKIAKILKSTENIENKFETELSENRRVVNIFDELSDRYLTISPLEKFLEKDVIGCIVNLYTDEKLHVIFSTKCNNKYDMDLDKLIYDILESIEILQTRSFRHNDIKLDNIVKCTDRYKLIDWEQCGKITDMDKKGTLIATSPIRWYINGYSPFISKSIISVKTTMRNYGFASSKIYKLVLSKINKEFDEVLKEEPDKSKLATKYAYSFDIFMLGMTALHAVYKYKLEFSKYSDLIFKMTSLKYPFKNAIEALTLIR